MRSVGYGSREFIPRCYPKFLTHDEVFKHPVTQLAAIPFLEVRIPEVPVEGTRGVISSLTGIVVLAAKSGAFSALINLAKDLYARYASCEVRLKFEDGSVLILKNLTQQQAEERIAAHLAQTSK